MVSRESRSVWKLERNAERDKENVMAGKKLNKQRLKKRERERDG